jgi:UPF0755 protein
MLKLLRLLAWGFASAAMALALVGGAAYSLYRDARLPGPLAQAKTLVVPAHSGVAAIADLLVQDGVVRHELTFAAIARLSGRSRDLQPGEYAFPPATSATEALAIIASGHTVKHRLTIPEGLTSPAIVALLRAAPALAGDPGPPPAEGSLFPDTYLYSYGETRAALLRRMQRAMAHVVTELWQQRWPDLPLAGPRDAVILASIVEKETARSEERAHIAGVYINRLRLGMLLDADPTVLFALAELAPAKAGGAAKLDRKLTHADLAIASPYNTYRAKGLPPGPIDNPGRASLRAAMQPEPTEDLYFVADPASGGGHVFARTLAEQTHNIAQYLHGAAAAVVPEPDLQAAPPPPPPPAKPAQVLHAAEPAAVRHRRHAAEQTAHLRSPCRSEPARPCASHLR